MDQPALKICLASSELTPLAKTGGLADVVDAGENQLELRLP